MPADSAVRSARERLLQFMSSPSYLIKAWRAAQENKPVVGKLQYLVGCAKLSFLCNHDHTSRWNAAAKCGAKSDADFRKSDVLLALFAHRAATMLKLAVATVDAHVRMLR